MGSHTGHVLWCTRWSGAPAGLGQIGREVALGKGRAGQGMEEVGWALGGVHPNWYPSGFQTLTQVILTMNFLTNARNTDYFLDAYSRRYRQEYRLDIGQPE